MPWSTRYARPALAALLLVAALAGLGAARPAVVGSGPWHNEFLPVAVTFECVMAALLLALLFIARRSPEPTYPADLLRAGLLRAIVLGMVAVAVLAALSRLNIPTGRGSANGSGRPPLPTPRP
ncbi:MAG: hypothetical protein J2P28_08975, partial [Actinobacteria bacterium]|nr:hypothetical protein [Actinomycetota bacterium]